MINTTTPPTLSDLHTEACMLASMIEGLDVLNDAVGHNYASQDVIERRASNAMRPMIEAVIKSAWDLMGRIEILDQMERREVMPRGEG